jgi:hypothetical protein
LEFIWEFGEEGRTLLGEEEREREREREREIFHLSFENVFVVNDKRMLMINIFLMLSIISYNNKKRI